MAFVFTEVFVSMKQVLIIIIIALLSAGFIRWLTSITPEAATGAPSEVRLVRVAAEPVSISGVSVELESFGNIEPESRYKIHALVNGQIIKKAPLFKTGSRVVADSVLLEIDSSAYELALANANSELAASVLALEDEKARAEQAERDWSKRNNPALAKDFVLRKPHLVAARARVESAKAAVNVAERDLSRTKLRAGFEGLISHVDVEQGAVISSSTILGEGFSSGAAEVRLPINAAQLTLLRGDIGELSELEIALENTLSARPEFWRARFLRLEASIEQQSQQVFIVAELLKPFDDKPDRHALLPGQYVKAKISGPKVSDVIVVPNELVYQGSYVYLVSVLEEPTLVRRDVSVLHRTDQYSIISSGLQPGDSLITTVLGQLPSGTRIEVTQ